MTSFDPHFLAGVDDLVLLRLAMARGFSLCPAARAKVFLPTNAWTTIGNENPIFAEHDARKDQGLATNGARLARMVESGTRFGSNKKTEHMKIHPSHVRGSLAVEPRMSDPAPFPRTLSPADADASAIRIRKILVPIDFSECSKQALSSAIAFAKQYGAEMVLLAVVPEERTSFEYGEAEFVSLEKSRRDRYERELRRLIETIHAGFPLDLLVRTGRPFQEIVSAARALNADVIVISTHGQDGFSSSTLGSTTEKVVRYAPCPVIVVRSKGANFGDALSGERQNKTVAS